MRGAFHKHGRVPARAGTTGPLRQGLTLGSLFPHQLLFQMQPPCPARAQEDRCLGRHCTPHWVPCHGPHHGGSGQRDGAVKPRIRQAGGSPGICARRGMWRVPELTWKARHPLYARIAFAPSCVLGQSSLPLPCAQPSPCGHSGTGCPWRAAGSSFGGRNLRDCTSGDLCACWDGAGAGPGV